MPTWGIGPENLDPSSPAYEEAVRRLLELGYLEQTHNPALGTTMGAYRLIRPSTLRTD